MSTTHSGVGRVVVDMRSKRVGVESWFRSHRCAHPPLPRAAPLTKSQWVCVLNVYIEGRRVIRLAA